MHKYKYEEAAVLKNQSVMNWHCLTCFSNHGSYADAEDKAARCCADEAPCINEECNNVIDYRGKYKGYRLYHRICKDCRNKEQEAALQRRVDRWEKMEKKLWDGKALLFSDAFDAFYQDMDEAFDRYEDLKSEGLVEKPEDLLLIICVQPRPHFNIEDYLSDYMPDEDYGVQLPDASEIEKAVNEYIQAAPLAWEPGKYALDVSQYDFEGTHYHRDYISPFTGEVK